MKIRAGEWKGEKVKKRRRWDRKWGRE